MGPEERMKFGNIEGVNISGLKQIRDNRGAVFHMLRRDSPTFSEFGEIYFSQINYGVIKGWKKHHKMLQNLAVPSGEIKLVIYDDRTSSASFGFIQEIELGSQSHHYRLVQIPPGVWYSFKGLSGPFALIANCASLPHDPSEVELLPLNQNLIPYHWDDLG